MKDLQDDQELGHKTYRDSLREMHLFSLVKRQFKGILLLSTATKWEGLEKTELVSSEKSIGAGQEVTDTS